MLLGQRIEAVGLDIWGDAGWNEIARATSIGSNRLIRLSANVTTSKVRLRIVRARACVALSDFGLFAEP